MKMSGEYRIPAPREEVWAALNDPVVLEACIPGAETVEKTADDEFQAVARTKVGPVNAKFKGKVQLTNVDPPNGYTISGQGNGGSAGMAKGSADVKLLEEEGGTLLRYDVDAQVSGKLAQIGQRFIDSTASKMADQFFSNFSERLGGERLGAPEVEEPIAPTHAPKVPETVGMGLSPWLWGIGVIALLLILILIFS